MSEFYCSMVREGTFKANGSASNIVPKVSEAKKRPKKEDTTGHQSAGRDIILCMNENSSMLNKVNTLVLYLPGLHKMLFSCRKIRRIGQSYCKYT